MRVNMYQNGGAGAQDMINPDGVASGPIILTRDPTLPMEAVPKQYVDTAITTLSASNITSGTLSAAFMPAYTGDATSSAGTATFTLAPSGVTPGRYTKVTVDSKGRVTAGSNIAESDLPPLSWADIALDKPTTVTGFGITDALRTTGGTLSQNLVLSGAPTLATHAATRGYLDDVVAAGATVQTPIGNIAQMLTTASTTGYLRCNGGSVSKTTYAALYAVVGDTYAIAYQPGAGQPWQQQYEANTTQQADLGAWTVGDAIPTTLYNGHQVFVTKNRVFFAGGTQGGSSNTPAIYSAPIDSSGVIGTFTAASTLPNSLNMAQVVVTKNRIYLIGGSIVTTPTASTWFATINSDGTLGSWSAGPTLPVTITHSSSFITKNRVYLVGGLVSGSPSAAVYSAPIDVSGVIGTWVAETTLPITCYLAAVAVIKNRVYLIGGYQSGTTVASIYQTTINTDGTLGTWSLSASALPGVLNSTQVVVTRKKLFVIAGTPGSNYSPYIYAAPINTDGSLGTFTSSATLPVAVSSHRVVVTSSRLYIIGGYTGSALSTLHFCSFSGGVNDYSSYYNGSYEATSSTDFRLPDLEASATTGTAYYIKY